VSNNPQHLGKYELQETLGQGGMALVKKAFDTQLRRSVAIKFLRADLQHDPNFMTRFEREAQVIASLHHPNIVQIYDVHLSPPSESEEFVCYMVMEYVEGQTLAHYLRRTSRQGAFPPASEMIHLFTAVGQAIDYAHQKGMIHRDIKPSNILLHSSSTKNTSDARYAIGEPVLSDFGIVKILGTSSNTLSNFWLGTPHYISPELVMGYPGNERSDIYSLGVILYEMCTGTLPFKGDNAHTVMMQHVNAMPTPPAFLNPNIPLPLSTVILRCLAKDPEARFPSASALALTLKEAFANTPSRDLNQTYSRERPLNSIEPNFTPHLTPSLSGPPPSSLPPTTTVSVPPATVPSESGHSSVVTPAMSPSQDTPNRGPGQHKQEIDHLAALARPSFPTLPPQSMRWRIALAAFLIIVVVGAGLSAFFVFSQRNPVAAVPSNQVVGHAFFVSSGQISELSNQGFSDELEIDLQNLPDPAPGKSYYAWLEPDKVMNMTKPILLGALPINHGSLHYLYPGDQQHTNILATMSRFLITEDDSTVTPNIPSPDLSTWRYSAQFPQPTSPESSNMSNNMSELNTLTHIRHLLVEAPELKTVGLPGGLDAWLFRNTQKVLEWSGSARDEWQSNEIPLMRRQIVRILDYLDGLSLVHKDAPGEAIAAIPRLCQLGLLDLSQHQYPSLLYLIDFHLNALIQSPDVTADQRTLAAQVDRDIKNTIVWLNKVHDDDLQMIKRSNQQLAQPSSLSILNDMTTQSLNAFTGRVDPSTGAIEGGVLQAHFAIQRLATFDIKPYK